MSLVLIRRISCMFGTSATFILIHWFTLLKFVLKFNGIKFVFVITYHSYHLLHNI